MILGLDLDLVPLVVSLRGPTPPPDYGKPGGLGEQEERDLTAFQRAGWSFHPEEGLDWQELQSHGFDGNGGEIGLLIRRTASGKRGLAIVRNRVVVGLSSAEAVPRLERSYAVRRLPYGSHLYEVELGAPDGKLLTSMEREMDSIRELAGGDLEFIEPVLVYHIESPELRLGPKVGFFKKFLAWLTQSDLDQWHWRTIQAREAWNETGRRGQDTLVAVVEKGFFVDDEFRPNVKMCLFVDENGNDVTDTEPFPETAHGTLCAGLVAATADDGGLNGAAPSCGLMLVALGETIDSTGIGAALQLCAQKGAHVVSCSVGPSKGSWDCLKTVTKAIDYLRDHGRNDKGTLVVWAVPNTRNPIQANSLESYPPLLCVAPSDEHDNRAPDSAYGDGLDLIAPGIGVPALSWDGMSTKYQLANGASVAAPCVAGVAALVLSLKPDLTFQQLTDVLTKDSCDPEENNKQWKAEIGWGRLNALRAVRAAARCPTC